MDTGTAPAISSKTTTTSVRSPTSPSSPADASTNAVPTFGCPANGISLVGVKIRTRRVPPFSGGSTKVLSEKLNSRVIFCICPSESPRASGRTARGLPPNRFSVKTSQMKYR